MKTINRQFLARSLSAFIGLSVGVQPALLHAEESAKPNTEASELSLEDILNLKVTVASLFKESELTAGSAVSVVTPNQWKKSGSFYTFQALENEPSAIYSHDGPGTQVFIRGFGTYSASRGLSITLDGVPLNNYSYGGGFNNVSSFGLTMLDRIEMIRGPGSSIYGSDAFTGVISQRTWSPTEDTYAADATVGSFGATRASVKASRELIPGLRFTAGGTVENVLDQGITTDYSVLNPVTFVPIGASSYAARQSLRNRSGFLKLNYDKAEAAFYYNDINEAGNRSNFAPLLTAFNLAQTNANQTWIGKISNTFSLPMDIDLDAKLYYWKTNRQQDTYDKDTLSIASVYPIPESRAGFSLIFKQEKNSSLGVPVRWLAGYQYDLFKIDEATQTYSGVLAPFYPNALVPSSNALRRLHGFLAQTDTALFNEQLHFLAGGRYDLYQGETSHFSPRLGLIYLPTESSAIKVLYSNAFHAPAATEYFGSASNYVVNRDLRPESIDTYELVLMAKSKQATVTSTTFTSKWTDGISIVSLPFFTSQYVNSKEAVSYGTELEGKYYWLGGNLATTMSGSFVRSADVTAGSARMEYTGFPRWILNYGVDYKIPSLGLDLGMKNFHHFDQTDGTGSDVSAKTALRDYFRTDLYAGWDMGHALLQTKPGQTELGLSIRNLWNSRNLNSSPSDYPGGQPEPGRSIQLSLRAQM